MALEAVAARAGVGKSTVYRWWSTRQALAVDAFFSSTLSELSFPDSGSAREDFRQQIHQLAAFLRGPAGAAMAAMISASRTDAVLRDALAQRWIVPRRRWGQARISKAIDEGECLDQVNPDSALELMYSPVYTRMLFGLGVPPSNELERTLQLAFRAIFRPQRVKI